MIEPAKEPVKPRQVKAQVQSRPHHMRNPSQAGDGNGLNVVGQAPVVANGPRGGLGTLAGGPGCLDIKPAVGNEPIKVTLWFNFQPLTPLIQQAVGNRIIITAYAVYRAEYSN